MEHVLENRTEVAELKARVDLVEVIQGSGVALRRSGRNWMGRCPFHADQNASFCVNPERQLWHCFGCQAAGDVFTFFQRQAELSFPEAVARVRELAGALPPDGKGHGNGARPKPGQEPEPRELALPGGLSRPELLGRVAELYRQRFLAHPRAQDYLRTRGLGDPELWEAFGIGYADGSLESLLGESEPVKEALVTLGVLSKKGREHFRGSLVVPLEHPDWGVVGLYGRTILPEARVRHLLLPGPLRGAFNWQALSLSPRVVLTEGTPCRCGPPASGR